MNNKQLVALQLDKSLVEVLKREAKANGLSLSAYIRFIIARRKGI